MVRCPGGAPVLWISVQKKNRGIDFQPFRHLIERHLSGKVIALNCAIAAFSAEQAVLLCFHAFADVIDTRDCTTTLFFLSASSSSTKDFSIFRPSIDRALPIMNQTRYPCFSGVREPAPERCNPCCAQSHVFESSRPRRDSRRQSKDLKNDPPDKAIQTMATS